MSPTLTDYSGHHRTLLPVREINVKACALVILNQIIQPDQDLNPDPTGNLLESSMHCVKPPGFSECVGF